MFVLVFTQAILYIEPDELGQNNSIMELKVKAKRQDERRNLSFFNKAKDLFPKPISQCYL